MIPWNVDDGVTAHLPNMNTDITLKSGEKILIIDAKYYAHTMQTVYDIEKKPLGLPVSDVCICKKS